MNSTGKIQPWPRNAEDLPASEIPMDVRPGATLSVDGRYRFTLLRECGGPRSTGAVWLTNQEVVNAAARNADLLVAAYGVQGSLEQRADQVLKELKDFNIHCLDTSLGGHPVHPLQRIKAITGHRLFQGKRR